MPLRQNTRTDFADTKRTQKKYVGSRSSSYHEALDCSGFWRARRDFELLTPRFVV